MKTTPACFVQVTDAQKFTQRVQQLDVSQLSLGHDHAGQPFWYGNLWLNNIQINLAPDGRLSADRLADYGLRLLTFEQLPARELDQEQENQGATTQHHLYLPPGDYRAALEKPQILRDCKIVGRRTRHLGAGHATALTVYFDSEQDLEQWVEEYREHLPTFRTQRAPIFCEPVSPPAYTVIP